MRNWRALGWLATFVLGLSGCGSTPLKTVEKIDLSRFMGIWYVGAHIPTGLEERCTNAVEYYRWLNPNEVNGRPGIENLFTCENEGTHEHVRMNGYAWVQDLKSNADWRIQFFWPLAFSYNVIGLSEDYSEVVVAHPSRKYLWIMSRNPNMPRERIDYWMKEAATQGFCAKELRIVPYTRGFKMSEAELRKDLGRRPILPSAKN